jgi:hypothetical protein
VIRACGQSQRKRGVIGDGLCSEKFAPLTFSSFLWREALCSVLTFPFLQHIYFQRHSSRFSIVLRESLHSA